MAISVSSTWKEAIQAQFRYPAYLRMSIDVTPPGLRAGALASAESQESISPAQRMLDGINVVTSPFATLEDGWWPGDGSHCLASEDPSLNKPTGWWSYDVAPEEQQLEFEFDKPYDIPGVSIVWDSVLHTKPLQVVISGYTAGGVLIATYTESSPDGFLNTPMEGVSRIVLNVTGWSSPNVRMRVDEISFGLRMVYSNDQIKSAKLAAAADLLSGELPSLGMNLTINNYDRSFDPTLKTGYAGYLAQRQLVELQWGFETYHNNVEWLDAWPMYLNSWKIPTGGATVELRTTSRLTFLDKDYSRGVYTGTPVSLLSIALVVLQDSGIIRNTADEEPWELDPVLSAVYTRAPAPVEACNALIQLIANAAGCILDINPANNWIRIRKSCASADYTIGLAQQLGDPSFDIIDRLRSIVVGLRTFSQQSERRQVYTFQGIVLSTITLEVVYDGNYIVNSPNVSISGATITGATYYARSAVLTIVPPIGGSTVTIQIDGYIVDESITWIQTYSDATVTSGIDITIDNPFITEMETLQLVSDVVKGMYLRQVEATVKYLGYPELITGDTVELSTNYGWFKGDINSASLNFNGGFDGTIKVKMLNVGALGGYDKSVWFSDETGCGEV